MVISNATEMSSTESSSQLNSDIVSKFHSLSLISLPIPCTDVQLNDRLVESSQLLKDLDRPDGLIRNNVNCSVTFETPLPGQPKGQIKKTKVLQSVFNNSFVACLLEDGRVCRIPYVLSLESCSNCDDSTPKSGVNNMDLGQTIVLGPSANIPSPSGSASGSGSVVGSIANAMNNVGSSSGTSSVPTGPGGNSSLTSRSSSLGMPFMEINRSRAQALRRRLMRYPRSRPLSNLQRNITPDVPEELITQAQAVLTGRSRSVISRELARTNLDVNIAVNNLLSRDDDDNDEEVEVMAQEELMSLLDSSYSDFMPSSDPPSSVSGNVQENLASNYMRSLRGWSLTSERLNINPRTRLFRDQNNSPNKPSNDGKKNNNESFSYNAMNITGPQEFWPVDDDRKFVAIAALHSELVALTDKGQLCQWRWSDPEPFRGQLADGIVYHHPKVPPLGLLQEKVTLLAASCIRASVVTKTGKIATWIDESIAPLVIKLEHVATANLFDGCSPQIKVRNLHVSSLMSVVQLNNGQVFWWGIPPAKQRAQHVEKIIKGSQSSTMNTGSSSSSATPSTAGGKNISGQSQAAANASSSVPSPSSKNRKERKSSKEAEIVQGSFVRMISSPVYQEGAIAFSTASGVPKVGQLVKPIWKLTDKCEFRILTPTEIQARFQSSSSSIALNLRASSLTSNINDLNKSNLEMPPPPSPASSTCSENSLQPTLPKRPKRTSSVYSSTASVQDKSAIQLEAETKTEVWPMDDLVFVEDGKCVTKELGKVIKIDGNFVAVKFNYSTLDQTRDVDSIFEECRIVQKQDLVLVKSDSGQTTGPGKIFDFFQRLPKRINIPRDMQLLTATLTNFNLHCIAKLLSGRCCYLVICVVSGKVFESFYMPNDFRPFNTITTSASSSPDQSLLKLYCAGETATTTVILCRDANGTIFPLERNKFHCSISDPVHINLGPITNIAMAVFRLPPAQQISDEKAFTLLLGLTSEVQYLMPSILKSNCVRLQTALEYLASLPPTSHTAIYEMCDGNRNILHAAACACFPKKNKNLIDSSEYQVVPINNEDLSELPMTLPHLETDEQSPAAHFVLTILLNSQVLNSHLFTLLTARDFLGFTPFMIAVSGRAYTAANYIFQTILKISKMMAPSSKETYNELMTQMIYPKGSLPDLSPLYILCTNDTCSFTWTGEEHINQNIFECRTCGLVGSLCCCTECARTCHRGHDCKVKITSPTAYCDCWEKCKCKSLVAGSQITRFALLEAILLNTDLVTVINSRGENILLHLLRTAIRQLHEQKQYRVSKHKNTSRVRGIGSSSSRNAANDGAPTLPDHDLDPPKFARKALERICRDWTAIKVMVLTGYRSFKAETNSDLNFYAGTATAFAYEEENYFLSRQDGTALLDKFVHLLLTSQFTDLLKNLVDTIVNAVKQEKEESEMVARRFVRSVGRVYFVVVSELNPCIFKGYGSSRSHSSSSTDQDFVDYLNCQDILSADKKNKSVPFISNVRKCLSAFGPLAIRELSEIAEALISPVRNGMVKPGESFWLTSNFSTSECSSTQVLDVPASVYSHQRDFIDPNTVDLPNDTASAQGASSLQDVNVLDEFENSQALANVVDGVPIANPRIGGGGAGSADSNANGSQDIDDDSDDTSNPDDSSFLSNADNASVAQRSVVTGATAGSDVGIPPMLFDDESMNSNAEDDDEEDDREEDEEDEERDEEGEEEGSSLPETDVNTDEENESNNFLNSIRSNLSFGRNTGTSNGTSNSRRNGLQHIQWAFDSNSSGINLNRRRPITAYNVSSGSGHENDISIPNTSVGLARNFGIMVRLVADLMFILRNGRVTPLNSWSSLSFTANDIVELHQYVEDRFAPTWSWLISVMNSCEGHLRFGCSVTQRRGQTTAQSTGTQGGSGTTASSALNSGDSSSRNDTDRSSLINLNYVARDSSGRFLTRLRDHEARTGSISTAPAPTSSSGNGAPVTANTVNIDSSNTSSAKSDFLSYAISLVRGHFDEHYDSLPVFDAYSYRHVAYVFDAFVFYMRGGRFMMRNDNVQPPIVLANTIIGQFGHTKRTDPFYQRPRSTLFHGCPQPDPFSVQHSESLPLSVKPHLLKSTSRIEEMFGIPSPANAEEAKAYLQSLPTQMSLSETIEKRNLSNMSGAGSASTADSKMSSKSSSSSTSPSSGKASVIVLAGSAMHEELSACLLKKSGPMVDKKIAEYEKLNGVEFYYSNPSKCDSLLCSWRLSMEIFGKVFADDVGAEPMSIINELAGYPIKEARFRREMEIHRPNSSSRDLILLQLERDRYLLLKQTFEELNRIYKVASDKSYPIARLKVTFKDEPGEGTGVTRSFFTAFSEVVLSPERFTAMNWYETGRTRTESSHLSRFIRRSQNYLRLSTPNGVALIQRYMPSDNSGSSSMSNSFAASLNLRVDAPPFRPSMSQSLPIVPDHINDLLGTRFSVGSAQDLHNRVMMLQPALASRITGMLLELSPENISLMLESEPEFHQAVAHAVELINQHDEQSNCEESNSNNSSTQVNNQAQTSARDDFEPLFYQPGPRGFYSPIAGKNSEARMNAFRNIGRIMGICLQLGDLCGITLNRHVIVQILGGVPTWHDMAFFDHHMYESFRHLINDAQAPNAEELFAELDFRFSIDLSPEEGGEERELLPGGRDIRVTPENVLDYVRNYSLYRMQTVQFPAIDAMRKGIFDVIPKNTLRQFTPEDFRLLLNGIQDINVQTLQSYVTFTNESGPQGANSSDLTYFRRWFWWVIEHMTPEEKQDLMYFWTGSPALHSGTPEGSVPTPSVTIRPRDDNYYVSSNTCISRLYVPLYSSRSVLRQKMTISIKDKTFSFI